ncbi:membrane-spanning 4-domains subfamily A member 4A-like isoform X2 [Tachysurus fulvidraco]|uniref:membrane-spanning 4-domains subfamily A member 4A-like isoform X2 n=1 Tax=Tachysurus fulvidraco TaxID=1234273 RepID=UPI001FEEC896|nr:membrane-spanning 4-domains subfamily A member 4A-like isoform X2 [Tachysurus fulvidraco]
MTPVTAPADSQLFRYSAFLKGEPKALGTVQIIIGSLTFLFGIVLTSLIVTPMVVSGITLWGSLVFVSCGGLSVATAKKHNPCMVKASLGMNVFSAVVAGVLIILLSVDMLFWRFRIDWCEYDYDYSSYPYYSLYRCQWHVQSMWYGLYGVLLVFAVLELIISICTSAFACKATCCSTTTPIQYSQPLIPKPMDPQPTIQQLMFQQPMIQQPLNPPPMYSPVYYNPQTPNQSVSVKS